MHCVTTGGKPTGDGVGAPVKRVEDVPLVTGAGKYTNDLDEPGCLYASFLRSRHAHAIIDDIDTSRAEREDEVVRVFTHRDLQDEDVTSEVPVKRTPSEEPPARLNEGMHIPRRPLLAENRVRYGGEPIALVIASNEYDAASAVDAIDVSYSRLDAVVDPVDATAGEAPRLHEDVPRNVALDWEIGNESEVASAFADAPNVIELDTTIPRLSPTPLEPRSVLADYCPSTDVLTVGLSTQVPHAHRRMLADVLGFPEQKVRVRTPHIGGGFGMKSKFYPAEILVSWCSVQLERPVKWQATRSESFRSDIHGRGHRTRAELAFEDDGVISALRVSTYTDLGGYVSRVAPRASTGAYAGALSNQYRIPAIHCRIKGVFTNKAPLDNYRGAGRPEAAFVVERLIQSAARHLGVDPAVIRQRNFIPPESFPYETPLGVEYDSGRYERAFERARELVDYDALRDRQRRLRAEGRYLGVGIGCFIETAGDSNHESSLVRLTSSGGVRVHLGSSDQGQSHKTTLAQVVASELGVPLEEVDINEGDTEKVSEGKGTYGSRTAMAAGTSLVESCRKIREQARKVAAERLEASETDIEFEEGTFHVRGVPDRSLSLSDIARIANTGENLPEGVERGLEVQSFGRAKGSVPFGTDVAVVEVDPRTGEVEFERFVAVDDCGTQINPRIVEGQIHGGLAQGIGQALYEGVVYDESGSLTTGSFLDYAMPRANNVPSFETDHTVTPSPHNPLGVKGVAESGTVGSPVAVVNAVVDALEPFGVAHLDMPVTPESVWRAIENGHDNVRERR